MHLRDLATPELSLPDGVEAIDIKGLADDSRAVGRGFLFAALPGVATDGARFVAEAWSAPAYRLHALPGTVPPKPGMVRVPAPGTSLALELWDVPLAGFGAFVAEVPPPLAIGSVELADGTWVKSFVCEAHAVAGATDISSFGGWRAYVASLA